MRNIHLINTGGTIEKTYQEHEGTLLNVEARMDDFLRRLRLPDIRLMITRLMNVDSLHMNDDDRKLVAQTVLVKQRDGFPIIITHGTDNMVETGLLVEQVIHPPKVPVVLTGAMVPLGFENTDGLQNLAEALFATQFLDRGVWVVFHGRFFPISNVVKNRDRGTFEAKSGDANS